MAASHSDHNHSISLRKVPKYKPGNTAAWKHDMRTCIGELQPLGLQIIEGEITLQTIQDEIQSSKLKKTASESLALARSTSYTMRDDRLPEGLFEEASSSDGDEDIDSSTDSDATLRYDQARSAGQSQARDNPDRDSLPAAADAEGSHDDPATSAGGGGSAMPAQPPRRRSSRLRKQGVAAPDQAGSAEDPDAEASKDSTEEKTEATEGDEQDRASTRSEATIEAEDGERSDDPQSRKPPTGDREDPRRPGDGRGELDQREDLKRRLRKMRRKLRHARRRKSRTKTTSGLHLLVKQAKAIGTLLAQTIDPRLWERLPQPIRIAAYNKANYNVWKMIMKSLGYSFKYLIGQLREGDGKSAWRRLVTLHAEETAGAETHYLQKLLMTSYKGVSGTNNVGHVRMFAEQLQRTNQDYKLAAGKFVPASILRSRILTLPKGYDSVVEAIETKNGTRAEDGREPLDFHEMVTMITQFENRRRRREEELLGESTKPRATKINRYFSSRRRPQHRRKHPPEPLWRRLVLGERAPAGDAVAWDTLHPNAKKT